MKEGLNPGTDPAEQKQVPHYITGANLSFQTNGGLNVEPNVSQIELTHTEKERLQRIISSGKNSEAISESILLAQKEGLSRLRSFLYRNGSFNELAPFIFDITKTSEKKSRNQINPSYKFSIGSGETQIKFSLTIPRNVKENNNGIIWAVPRSLNKGEKPYYWLEFYNPDDQNVESGLFDSCRLRPDQQRKIEFTPWHGAEEAVLVDYILGENDISFEDLKPIDLKQKPNPYSYCLGGKEQFKLHLLSNQLITCDDNLRLLPQQDEHGVYQWLDIMKAVERQEKTEFQKISSYRIDRDEHTLKNVGWPGFERQVLIDFLSGKEGIFFNNLKPIYVNNENSFCFNAGKINGCNVAFNYPKKKDTFKPDEEGVLIPKQDEEELYQWLELYKINAETRLPIGELLESGRLFEGKIIQDRWLGPERQLLKDYVEGKIRFDQLKPLSLIAGGNKNGIYIGSKDDKKQVFLALLQYWNINPDDRLTIVPEKESEEASSFLLFKENQKLARYKLDREKQQFFINNNFVGNEELILSYEAESNTYIDADGNRWLNKTTAGKRLEITYYPLKKILTGVPTILYKKAGSGMTLLLFKESEILENDKRIRSASSEPIDTKKVDVEEANNYLRDLVFGEEKAL